jgi:DNA-binding XRE family transcriptional regulator
MNNLPTFTMGGTKYAIVPLEMLAELGAARETATMRKRRQLGARLKAARERAGLTQGELAERLGKAQVTVAHAESGRMRVGERYAAAVLDACGLANDWTPAKGGE